MGWRPPLVPWVPATPAQRCIGTSAAPWQCRTRRCWWPLPPPAPADALSAAPPAVAGWFKPLTCPCPCRPPPPPGRRLLVAANAAGTDGASKPRVRRLRKPGDPPATPGQPSPLASSDEEMWKLHKELLAQARWRAACRHWLNRVACAQRAVEDAWLCFSPASPVSQRPLGHLCAPAPAACRSTSGGRSSRGC